MAIRIKNTKGQSWIIFLGVLVLILLVWGYIGGQEAQKVGVTCDMGIGDNFCWKWHKNVVGEASEFLKNTGDAIRDSFEN